MKLNWILFALAIPLSAALVFRAVSQPADTVATVPTFIPDYTHANDPLPPGIIAWDETTKNADTTNGQDFARFVFAFTNVATAVTVGEATNVAYTTNFTVVTNRGFWNVFSGHKFSTVTSVAISTNVFAVTNTATPVPVAILSVHPSCGCTTAELPPTPWLLPPGTNSVIRVAVNLAGKSGIVFKTVAVSTDKGKMDLMLKINMAPPPPPQAMSMSEADRAAGIAAAKVDRQAVFKGDCVTCHAKNVDGKYNQELFALVCAVCHEAEHRGTMVPDLHNLKVPTSEEFWRAWITSGKAGTLMPAFATAQGGPLTDMQIGSLASYLNATIPSHVPPAAK